MLLKGRIPYKMSFLQERPILSRNIKIELESSKETSILAPPGLGPCSYDSKIEELAQLVNKIASFGHISLLSISAFNSKLPTIFLRFSSLNSAKNFFTAATNINKVTKVTYLQDLCDYKLTDKLLYINEQNRLTDFIFKQISQFGAIHKFKKVSMKKILIQFDDERSVLKFRQFKNKLREKFLSTNGQDQILNSIFYQSHSSQVRECNFMERCLSFTDSNKSFIFFDNTNPYKLRNNRELEALENTMGHLAIGGKEN